MRLLVPVAWIVVSLAQSSAQWTATAGVPLYTVSSFAGTPPNLIAGTYGGVYLSSDGGMSWNAASPLPLLNPVGAVARNGNSTFAGTLPLYPPGGTYLSTDAGLSWVLVTSGLTATTINALAFNGSYLLAGTDGGVFRSTNSGQSWSAASSGLEGSYATAFAARGFDIFVGIHGTGVFRSTNNGALWTKASAGLSSLYVLSFAVRDSHLFVGTRGGGVFRSTNNGANWVDASLAGPKPDVYALAVIGKKLFAGAGGGGRIYLSMDDGASWITMNEGLPTNFSTFSLYISGDRLLAGGSGSGVWSRPLSEMVTSVDRPLREGPVLLGLSQNYPNPFNSTTVISFHLQTATHVELSIRDLVGHEAALLVNGTMPAGVHNITFDASNLPSGVYFYRLRTDAVVETRKLCIIR